MARNDRERFNREPKDDLIKKDAICALQPSW